MKHIIYLFLYLSFTTAQAPWNITLPNGEILNLQWQERENSQQTKGIHTFVGYSQSQFVATLVVHPNKEASGSLQWEGITTNLQAHSKLNYQQKSYIATTPMQDVAPIQSSTPLIFLLLKTALLHALSPPLHL